MQRTLGCDRLDLSLLDAAVTEPLEDVDWLSLLEGCEGCLAAPLEAILTIPVSRNLHHSHRRKNIEAYLQDYPRPEDDVSCCSRK